MKPNSISQFMVLLFIFIVLSMRAYSCPWPGWFYTYNPVNHTIAIPVSATITCDGTPIANGDWIGVFYDSLGITMACAGYVMYTGGVIAMTAMNDDGMTSPDKEGFYTNECFQWRIYKCSTGLIYYGATVTYSTLMPNQGCFAGGGLSQLTSLIAVSQIDLSITGWVAPNTGCNLGASEEVKVTVYNAGPGPANNFTMSYSVNGGSAVTQQYTGTAIAVGSSTTFIFSQTVNMSQVGTYNFSVTVTVNIATDPVLTNNTITQSVIKTPPPSVTISGLDSHYCFSPGVTYPPIPITGSPPGGSFACSTSPGVTGNVFIIGSGFAELGLNEVCYGYLDSITGCTGTDTFTVNITQYPTATFSGLSSNHYCIYDNVPLTGNPSGGTFFGSTYINAQNIFNPLTPGTFNIGYVYTDLYGCADTSNISSVIVNSLPVVDIVSPLHAYCVSDCAATLNGTPSGGTFSISGNCTNCFTGNVFHPCNAGIGIYTLTYTYTNPTTGCTNTKNMNIKIFALPVVDFSGLATEYCKDTTPVILNGVPPGGTWTGTWQNNIFKPLTVGTMSVTYGYTATNWYYGDTIGCLNTKTRTTIVHPLPVFDIGAGLPLQPDGSFQTAAPDTVHLNAGLGWTSYHWNTGSTSQTIVTSGYGWYSVTVTNGWMCAGHDSLFIGGTDLKMIELVSPKSNCVLGSEEEVTVRVLNAGTKTFTIGMPVFFEYKINNGTVVNEQKFLDEDLPPDSTLDYTFYLQVNNLNILANVGVYIFRIAVTYNGDMNNLPDINHYNDTLYVLVENGGLPVMDTFNVPTNQPDSGIVLDAGVFAQYLWNTAETSETITVISFGTYTVTVTDEFGCTTSGSFIVYDINDIDPALYHVSLFPNPNNGRFNLCITAPVVSDFDIRIINTSGKEIYRNYLKGVMKEEKKLNLSELPQGVYYLKVTGNSGTTVRKFVLIY